MLLSKIPCLDKGFVALVSSMNDSRCLTDVGTEFFGVTQVNPKTMQLAYMTLAIKCPLFVQTNLSQFGLNIVICKKPATQDVEAYKPNAGEIGSKEAETNRVIADDIERTTEALLINPKAYQADGCDRFMSQLIMPVSVYTTLLISGSYEQWSRFANQANLPAPIESYRSAVQQILITEWK